MEKVTEMSILIRTEVVDSVNYAAIHLKRQFVLQDICLEQVKTDTLVCRITSVPEFLYKYEQIVQVHGDHAMIPAPKLVVNDAFYRKELIEAREGEIRIELYDPEKPDVLLGFYNAPIHVQPYLHWDASEFRETLPAFMQPNDPLVMQVIKKAGEYAVAAGDVMCGYQCKSAEGVKRQAAYIYRALQDSHIHYISAPASFETCGQKVRIPHQVLHEVSKQGTCLDLAILYVTCLEAVSLNGAVILVSGHAFAGVWMMDTRLTGPVAEVEDMKAGVWDVVKRDLLPVECTSFTDDRNIDFEYAVQSGEQKMEHMQYMSDISASRNEGIDPVYTYTDLPICGNENKVAEQEFIHQEFSKEKKSKIALLREQAMDITTKSRLLNCEPETLVVDFTLNTESFMQENSSDSDIVEAIAKKSGKKKNQILRELYSKSRLNIRETGKSNLFISINELRWCQESTGKNYRAVMYLCPAEIYRNGRGDFRLRLDSSEVFFNPALKVFLGQGYHLDSEKLLDHPGIQYRQQMNLLSFLIENQKGWFVKENVGHLALYTIPNEAIWRGLNDESVLNHEIVKGILKGKMDWDNNVETVEAMNEISDIYTCESDSSQDAIIKAAFQKKAQVVVGPAGNGKTQTIVNIMMEAVRRGQKVLFVSEMAPAMEVVAERLNRILGGLFNLQIIQGKNKAADVMAQIRRTLDYMEMQSFIQESDDITEAKRKYEECLTYLEQYYNLMSTKDASCGKSLEELIDMYEKYADCPLEFTLDEVCANIPLSKSADQVGILANVMGACDRAQGDFSEYVRYDNLDGKEESLTLKLAKSALETYDNMYKNAVLLREHLGIDEDLCEKEQVRQAVFIGKYLKNCPIYHKSIDTILEDTETSDYSWQELLLEELEKLAKMEKCRVKIPEFIKKSQREKCFELLRKIYTVEECRNMVHDFVKTPEEVKEKINSLKIVRDEDDGISLGSNIEVKKKLSAYLKELVTSMKSESKEVQKIVAGAAEQIVSGNGRTLKELARRTWESYLDYKKAENLAMEKIVKNDREFGRNHPDIPRKVLFEEWIENRNIDTNRSRSIYDSIAAGMEKDGYKNLISQIKIAREQSVLSHDEIMNGFYKAWASWQIDRIQEGLLEKHNFNYFIFQDRAEQLSRSEEIIRQNLSLEIAWMQKKRIPNIQEGVSNNSEFGILQKLVRNKKTAIRTFFEMAPHMLQELCPCMIMDPSAVAEHIPTDFPAFDLVLIDEGSQMPTYNALIPVARGKRCMIFGDEKQLQPSEHFKKQVEEDFDMEYGRESVLTAAYITSMPRKMLRFHYRSENESLLTFSNIHYYNGDIITFPSCDTNIEGVSYEFVENGFYDRDGNKGNLPEAERVIKKIREIYEKLPENTEQTLGVITLNIHQRNLIQNLLLQEVTGDSALGMKVDELVSVVNLESCQGKEWDYVILSPGFANDKNGRFSSGFGALNREYGENRLNVMLTRARRKMIVITSIEPYMLSGARSAGVRDFREFLQYAKGDVALDTRERDSYTRNCGLVARVASELEKLGYEVHTNIGSSEFKVDIGIVSPDDPRHYILGILVDHYRNCGSSIYDREVIYPKCLKRKGWNIYRLRKLNWINNWRGEIRRIIRAVEVQ